MLSQEELLEFRRAFEKVQRRPKIGPSGWDTILGGPLDGLRVRKQTGMNGPTATWGFATVIDCGCVQALYEHGDKPGEWRFQGWSRPGGEYDGALASGLRVASVKVGCRNE